MAAIRIPGNFAFKGPPRLSDQPASDDAAAVTRDNEVRENY